MICFISLPLWAVFVALARGDLIIISPLGQVVNIIFQVFWFFLKVFAFPSRIPVFMRVCVIFTFLKRMCEAYSLARRVHLRQTTASRECASPAHNSFYVIGNSIGISYYIKKNRQLPEIIPVVVCQIILFLVFLLYIIVHPLHIHFHFLLLFP